MTGRPRILKPAKPDKARHYTNNNALYNIEIQRREFIKNLRAMGVDKARKIPITVLEGVPCGLYPTCKKSATQLWIWSSHSEYLCETEVKELRKSDKASRP